MLQKYRFPARAILLSLLIIIITPLFASSCKKGAVPKKVSLERRIKTAERDNGADNLQSDAGALKFWFDLRLGPKEDVRIYLPFLKYLEQNSGNRFSIRFTEKYEDTVETLGNGITQFAALGPVIVFWQRENTVQAVL